MITAVAHAAGPPAASSRVAVIGPADAAVAQQLDAELQLLGFSVIHASAPDTVDPTTLRSLATDLDVAAAILVDTRDDHLDLWVVDRVTGKTTIRVVEIKDARSPDAARIGALRAIDLLRASFRELSDVPTPPEAEVAPSAPVQAVVAPRRPRLGIMFGPAVSGSPGGIGATAHAAVALEFMPHRIFGLGVRGFAPIAGARVQAPQGAARIHIGWLTVGPRVNLTPRAKRVHVGTGVAGGPLFVGMVGEAAAPFSGRRDMVVTALIELDVAVALAVHPRLRVWLDGALDMAVPQVGVRFAGQRAATWGLPVGVGVLGLQVVL